MKPPPDAFWVLGTDTGVGKTFVSALLLRALAERALAPAAGARYWKPIASGLAEGSDDGTVAAFCEDLVAAGRARILPSAYAFREPHSPHLAARLEGRRVEPERVLALLAAHRRASAAPLIVEGVGGLLVPLTDDGELLADLVAASALPSLLVTRSTLGTLNHTLLSLAAMRSRGMALAGVILNGPPHPENRRAIERFGGVEVLAEVPAFAAGATGLPDLGDFRLALDQPPEVDQ